ncbi:hypothetical protein GTQ34_09615 [Muricauda sp. JGD-17]|uniref:Uncharacterized protein n=1 Tax=Flagellimonas ochracea TaxID=2696472 RepID=A0A964TET9_9FLAO|nr:SRPBCC family protein [Allomuricauda ochracea]NAY92176.1 hypothetical protein [Allomuricauda ochracea]
MNTLQQYLTTNAIFSTLTGALVLLFTDKTEEIFGVAPSNFFLVLGVLLMLFTITLLIEIVKQRALAVLWIIVQDMLWVLASAVLLIFNPFNVTVEGNLIIALVAIVVLLIGIGQAKGLAQIDNKNKKALKVFQFSRIVNGTKAKAWEVISDVGNYHKVAPNIDGSEIISGEKKGMVRTCSHGKDSWRETCTLWEDEKQYSFVVDTSPADYPFPLKSLQGNWRVDEISDKETEITMTFEFEYKKGIQNILVHPLMKYKFTKVCKELLDNWQEMIED